MYLAALVLRHVFSQAERSQCVGRQISARLQTLVALITDQRMTCLRPQDAVDSSMVITCCRQFVLEVGNLRGDGGPIVRTGTVPAIPGRIVAALIIIGRIVAVLIVGRGPVVRARIIAVAIWIPIAVAVWVTVGIIIVGVVIVEGPAEPREETDIEDEPGTVHKAATVPVPEMVAPAVPIAIPIGRALREDVIMPGTNIANCSVPAAGLELRGAITTTALYFCEAIVMAALHFREPIDM